MLEIKSWEDVGGIVTAFSAPFILLSVYLAFRQIRIQADISRKDLTFNGLASNSAGYRLISDYLQNLKERYERDDKTINYRTAYTYYAKYWLHTSHQWDFFEAGLIPYHTFRGWCLYSYGMMSGELDVPYFDKEGIHQNLNSRDVFVTKFIDSVYKNHHYFYEFYLGLYQIGVGRYEHGIIPKDKRMSEVSKYIQSYMNKRSIKSL
ncbi:hypothetical protein [Asticcacaulis machinosus]|uniref:Uncharacterized protein n=1 Tax=Asticcacaulis machinosus TaxID=2984211 RepID=A0ABT5HHZ0_9CAUL|nr:hypothetical protein [Asticcacaulis machinosus]MDC7675861.1 hypothetical protein [Asticcacaulis machinosus]